MVLLRRLVLLERRTVRAAQRFSDYNFRSYFVEHTKESFAAVRAKLQAAAANVATSPQAASAAKAERRLVLRNLLKDLRRMRRMSLINKMYAKQKVVVDPRRTVPEL